MADNVKTVSVKMSTDGYDDARLKIEKLSVAADDLGRKHPEITPQIDSAKALLEARLLRDGIKKELSGATMDIGGSNSNGGFLSKLAMLGGGNGSGGGLFTSVAGEGGSALTSPAAIAGIVTAVGLLLPELGGVVAGLSAATAGVGAFGLLALPTFDKIKNAYTAIGTAQQNYNKAAQLNKTDPTKANATAAATALMKLKAAQDAVGPSTTRAVDGIHDLISTFDKMGAAFQPQVMTVFNQGLKIASQLLPTLKTPATDAAGAIDKLLTQFSKFTQSQGFKTWLGQFDKLIGPSIAAIGHGIDLIVTQVGKLFTRFSGQDAAHALNIFFDTVFGVVTAIVKTIGFLMSAWDSASKNAAAAWHDIEIWFDEGAKVVLKIVQVLVDNVLGAFGTIIDGAAKAFGWIPGIGGKLKTAAKAFDGFQNSVYNSLSGAQKTLQGWVNHLEAAPKVAKIKGDITDLQAKLNTAEKQLANPDLTKARTARIEANISNLEAQIASAKAQLTALNGTTATTYITTVNNAGAAPPHKAAGGPASGWILAGERGAELIRTPPGSYVYPHAATERMLSGASGGSTYNINVSVAPGSEREAGRQIVAAIRKYEQGSGSGWRKH